MITYLKSNWLDLIQAGVSIWVAIVATLALKTWKQKSKAQRQMDFMDEITDTVHEFIQLMSAPTTLLKYIRLGIDSFPESLLSDPEAQNAKIVAYIQRQGEEDQKKLTEYLAPCRPSLNKIRSLSAKGQVLNLQNYADCQNACGMLAWLYERIEAISYIIGNVSLNWDNPEVQKTLSKVMDIDSQTIEEKLKEQNVLCLTFIKKNYQKIHD